MILAFFAVVRPMIARLVTDLPEPDSPTIASVLPLLDPRRHAVDGVHEAVLGAGTGPEVADVEEAARAHPSLTRGSMTAYRRSTIRLATMTNVAATSTVPVITGRSDVDDGVHRQLAEAREVEHVLGDHRAAEQAGRSRPAAVTIGVRPARSRACR